ncbi:hypothetical protein ACL6C3_12420 [Capilliphycus salinus ALCB114379]|uniref:hypothetical protein n=1 Tax=Capilliphycus salinus TaxID=2768948 RepID=UPI0039A5EA19
MTSFPGSPKSLKGAIVAVDLTTRQMVSSIAFQYNPDTITRSLDPQMSEGNGAKAEALYIKGAPRESIQLDIELDATDQLEKGEKTAVEFGIYPQLSALECLVYPTSIQMVTNLLQAKIGRIEIGFPEAPLTLLVWGYKRVLPVQLTNYSITEEAYDVNLNPIMAKVSLSLRVLNYSDLPWNRGAKLFLAHHITKELMANKATLSSLGSLGGSLIN